MNTQNQVSKWEEFSKLEHDGVEWVLLDHDDNIIDSAGTLEDAVKILSMWRDSA